MSVFSRVALFASLALFASVAFAEPESCLGCCSYHGGINRIWLGPERLTSAVKATRETS